MSHGLGSRRACAALGQHRSTQRKVPRARDDEQRLTADIIELAWHKPNGYREIAELLRQAGWTINDKRVECIWQREELKVPHKQISPASSRRSMHPAGYSAYIRSDNGPEFVAKTVQLPDDIATLRRLVVPHAMPSLLARMRGIEAEADWASATYAAATLFGIARE